MEKKYELIKDDHVTISDIHILYRIVALRDIHNPYKFVPKGTLGGYIESEQNLSQDGECWIYDDAYAYMHSNINVNAAVCDSAEILESGIVTDQAIVSGNATLMGHAIICGTSKLMDHVIVGGTTRLCYNATVCNYAIIYNNPEFGNEAFIRFSEDYIIIGPIGSRYDYTTFYKTKDNGIYVMCGCFNGSLEAFRSAVQRTHKNTEFARDYYLAANLAQAHLLHAS